jgi:hypothetical protein
MIEETPDVNPEACYLLEFLWRAVTRAGGNSAPYDLG